MTKRLQINEDFIKEINYEIINSNIDFNLNLISKYPRGSFLKRQDIEIVKNDDINKLTEKTIVDFFNS